MRAASIFPQNLSPVPVRSRLYRTPSFVSSHAHAKSHFLSAYYVPGPILGPGDQQARCRHYPLVASTGMGWEWEEIKPINISWWKRCAAKGDRMVRQGLSEEVTWSPVGEQP